jgi:signal transduction histidine kinase
MTTSGAAGSEPQEPHEPPAIAQHRSLRRSLNVLTVAIAVLLVLITVVSSIALLRLVDARHTLLDQIDPASLSADQLQLAYVDEETGVRGFILSRNPLYLQPTVSGLTVQRGETRALNADLREQPDLLPLATRAEKAAHSWQTTWVEPAILATGKGSDAYASPLAQAVGKQLLDRARAEFNALNAQLAMRRSQGGANLNSATNVLAVVVGGGIALLVGGLVLLRVGLRRLVTTPLGQVAADARKVSQGDLSHEISAPEPIEILELGIDIEAMRLRIVRELREVEAARHELDERNEDLRRSNTELEQFAYVASHDLQEPLRKVTSFVRLLQQRYEGQLDERADQYIEFAVDGASRMQQLISDLLAFSRVGRNTDRFEHFPMGECVVAALDNLDASIVETGTHVEVAELPDAWGDRALVVSLWQNLIGNSVKFRSEEAPLIAIGVEPAGGQWQFSITDNGIGIEPRFADKVFVIFQRLHGRDSYPGTGIGLALCQKIVAFHGGRIWLDTGHQSGTRICFTLPMAATSQDR